MLTTLLVHNFAVIEEIEADFTTGLTVVTGETGAGKSLLVDALMLLSGTRADNGMIRAGCKRAELHATFSLTEQPRASAWLDGEDMDDGDECQLRRVLKASGSSRAWINGHPATLTQLGALASMLVEIHGQHEHQTLLSRPHQLSLLDAVAMTRPQLGQIGLLVDRWREIAARRKKLTGGADPAERIDLLRHELDDLQRWALTPEDLTELEADHRRLANAERLLEGARNIHELIDGDSEFALGKALTRAESELDHLADTDAGLKPVLELISTASIQVGEAAQALSHYAQDVDLDPARYEEVDQHLSHLHDLSRRHRVHATELVAKSETLQSELEALQDAGNTLQELTAESKRISTDYAKLADAVGQARHKAATSLSTMVTGLMQELGMVGGVFEVQLEDKPGDTPDSQGRERCQFLVSANAGQPPRPLRKVASGGELARISLAIEVATLGMDEVGTMVFDEVDAGIGGAVAEIVGQKLRALGTHRQVLCVTHLPQVAAQGHQHLHVHKHQHKTSTDTRLDLLTEQARQDELARMLGGIDITAETRAHANKMLEQAQASSD